MPHDMPVFLLGTFTLSSYYFFLINNCHFRTRVLRMWRMKTRKMMRKKNLGIQILMQNMFQVNVSITLYSWTEFNFVSEV